MTGLTKDNLQPIIQARASRGRWTLTCLNVRQVEKVIRLLLADLARRFPSASQRLASLTSRRSPALAQNGLMLRGLFDFLALVLDLPRIFLALVLDCLGVTLRLLCHTHNRLLCPRAPTPPRQATFPE